ncbi:MAG: hypothetical protein JW820_08500 [Spirochaetales bacterium]|nr:hypothetical protein [Spirochaetales bacterium]
MGQLAGGAHRTNRRKNLRGHRLLAGARWALLGLLLLLFLGCFDSAILITVEKDGSGTVEETVILSNAFTELMASFAAGMGGEGEGAQQPEEEQDLVDEDRLRAKAAAMGPGVELVSAEPVVTDSGSGFRALYRFEDINTLRVNQNPSDNVPGPPTGGEESENPEELLQFRFTRGATATLEILYPEEPDEQEAEQGLEELEDTGGQPDLSADPEMEAMIKELYKDMRIRLAVEVAGGIVETNASYRDGSRVTLMDVDFGKLMAEGDKFDELMQAKPETVEEMKELLEEVDSIKIETARNIRIRFR